MPRLATCMKVNMKMTRRTEWVNSPGKVVTTIRDATRMTRGTAMERCTGKMGHATRVNGREASSTA